MKTLLLFLGFAFLIYSCEPAKSTVQTAETSPGSEFYSDTLRIANESIEYEIIIIEPGFNAWLITQPTKGFYGLNYLENRNRRYVIEYNNRVYNSAFSRNLYEQEINYDPNIRYGLEVNYLLYNYFKYFEATYNQKLR
ncbi:MAG: hypothetical protein H0X63_10560 [Flavobacteriales bacterium]|nr:hypothetical protein [Flavobacteriales bacterium]